MPHQHPSGLIHDTLLLPHAPYANSTGAIIHAWRPSHWFTSMFGVGGESLVNVTTWTVTANTDTCWRAAAVRADTATLKYLGNLSSSQACEATLTASIRSTAGSAGFGSTREGGGFVGFVAFCYFHDDFADADFRGSCYGLTNASGWQPTAMRGVDTGRAPGPQTALTFRNGGDQGGEGFGAGAEWYIENVLEELDAPNEFFFDERRRELHYVANSSGVLPPSADEFTATRWAVIFNVSGSAAAPVRNLAIRGIELADTAATFLAPHGLPSGGDWALQRSGAVSAHGTANLSLTDCMLRALDGNGVFLGGFHRGAVVARNEFVELGGSAVALWGDTSTALNANGTKTVKWPVGPDARGGLQPWDTTIEGNLAREIGIFQKQSSFVFFAIAARTRIVANVVFNIPRAAVNANDGHGGGDEIAQNLFVNTCRESGDHGPYNSWDRQPYITNLSGVPSVLPMPRRIHHNFMIGNYFVLFAVDTDDGSAYYEVDHNFLASSGEGLKSNCGGHDMHHHHNIYAYPWGQCWQVAGGAPGTPGWAGGSGYADSFINNTCILINPAGYPGDCGDLEAGFRVSGNRVLTQDGTLKLCGHSLQEWQRLHPELERGTSVGGWPMDAQLIAVAQALLYG